METITEVYTTFFGSTVVVAPEYFVLLTLVLFGVYLWRRKPGGSFLAFAFPRAVYRHKSTVLDFWLFVLNRTLYLIGFFARLTAIPAVAATVASNWTGGGLTPDIGPLLLAFIFFVTYDFLNYWQHRIYHTWKAIWPLHAVHHSAEVLTPLTTYRQHPLTGVIATVVQSIGFGIIYGVLLGVLDGDVPVSQIAGANAFVVITNALFHNMHHIHVWLSWGPIVERVFISPAQHQVHHSRNKEHYNRNFGTVFALWDWMFGTLYITSRKETIEFGLSEPEEAELMRHSFWATMIDPPLRLLKIRRPSPQNTKGLPPAQ